MEEILEEAQMAKQVKAAMLVLADKKDILTEMEEVFSECNTGITWVEMQKKEGRLAVLFAEVQEQEKEMDVTADGEEDLAAGLLGLLEKEDMK